METNVAVSHVVIIGAGELGRAVEVLMKKKNIPVSLWDAKPGIVSGQEELKEIVPAADYVLFCVPSWAMRAAVTGVAPYLSSVATVMSFAKGIEKDSLQTMGEMIPSLLFSHQAVVVVGGPMIAEEIVAGKKAIGIFASHDAAALARIAELFRQENFDVEMTDDVLSVSLAGVLKNIYAVALGIADGLDLSGNEKGWIASRAIIEMQGIAVLVGADPAMMIGTAGEGDLIATGYSEHSRNREVGAQIVKTGMCDLRAEGLESLPYLRQRLGARAAEFPLLMLVNTVGIECKPARPAFDAFF
jgi:glycerol-3-phosphate dehydrogenase (NAD(P)+)